MFHIYVLFLLVSGIAMLAIAFVRNAQSKRRRLWNAIFGAAFTGYGLYLLLFFRGGHYLLFFYAFVLPVIMIVQFFRDRSALRARQAAGVQAPPGYSGYFPPAPPAHGQPSPSGYGQPPAPGYGQPSPSGYGQPSPSGYGQPSAPGYGQPSPSGYGQPPAYPPPPGDQPQGSAQ